MIAYALAQGLQGFNQGRDRRDRNAREDRRFAAENARAEEYLALAKADRERADAREAQNRRDQYGYTVHEEGPSPSTANAIMGLTPTPELQMPQVYPDRQPAAYIPQSTDLKTNFLDAIMARGVGGQDTYVPPMLTEVEKTKIAVAKAKDERDKKKTDLTMEKLQQDISMGKLKAADYEKDHALKVAEINSSIARNQAYIKKLTEKSGKNFDKTAIGLEDRAKVRELNSLEKEVERLQYGSPADRAKAQAAFETAQKNYNVWMRGVIKKLEGSAPDAPPGGDPGVTDEDWDAAARAAASED